MSLQHFCIWTTRGCSSCCCCCFCSLPAVQKNKNQLLNIDTHMHTHTDGAHKYVLSKIHTAAFIDTRYEIARYKIQRLLSCSSVNCIHLFRLCVQPQEGRTVCGSRIPSFTYPILFYPIPLLFFFSLLYGFRHQTLLLCAPLAREAIKKRITCSYPLSSFLSVCQCVCLCVFAQDAKMFTTIL